jgi:hypothetical protein
LRGFAPIGANNPTSIRLRADEMIESDECRLMADIVAKVPEQMLWNCNLKQSNRGEYSFESTLRACARY